MGRTLQGAEPPLSPPSSRGPELGLTGHAGTKLVREFRDEVIVNSVLGRAQDDHWPGIVNCKREPQPEPHLCCRADPTATFGMALPSPCWQWVPWLTRAPKGASSVRVYLLLVTVNMSFPSDPNHLRGPREGSAGLQGCGSAKLLPCLGRNQATGQLGEDARGWGSDGSLRVRSSSWQGQTTEAGPIQPAKGSAGFEHQPGLEAVGCAWGGGALLCSRDLV